MQPIDQFSDPGFKTLSERLRSFPGVDLLIKTAELDDDENAKVASTAFAWPEQRLFRIDSPAQAALSKLYMSKQADIPEHVTDTCNKALELYGVTFPEEYMVKKASTPLTDYLLPHLKRFKVTSKEHVKVANAALFTNRRKMDTNTRAQASINLVKKAAQFKQQVSSFILKTAGTTLCDTQVLRDWLNARSVETADVGIANGFRKLANETLLMPALAGNREDLVKVACAIQELDEAAGLDNLYDTKLPDPLQTVFNTDKIASDVVSVAGKQIPLETLLSIDPEVYQDLLGSDLAGDFISPDGQIDEEQFKIIFPTVPLDLQKVLAAQIGV